MAEPRLATTEEIQEQLEAFTITIDDEEVLLRMHELCFVYKISAEDIALAWMAFFSRKQLNREPTLESLSRFELEELPAKKKKSFLVRNEPREIAPSYFDDAADVMDTESDLLQQYSSPGVSLKRVKTPDASSHKRSGTDGGTRIVLPLTQKTSLPMTPSQKYSSCIGQRIVVRSFGDGSAPWKGDRAHLEIKPFRGETKLDGKYRYMFEKLHDRAAVLNDLVCALADALRERHGIEDWSTLDDISAEEIAAVGRVFCNRQGKLTPGCVWLEGSQEIAAGRTIRIDVDELQDFSLFPGEIVGVIGTQSNRGIVVVKQLFGGCALPKSECRLTLPDGTPHLQIVVAAGPFTTSETLCYEPLDDLVDYVVEQAPHFLILVGPFVDTKHELIESGAIAEPYSDVFERHVAEIYRRVRQAGTQLILIPSLHDVHHDEVYPVPPFSLKHKPADLHCFSDPCVLDVAGFVVGISSTDVLLHLGKEETSRGSSDRMGRLCRHILAQRNFYPLYPPSEDVNVDYARFELHALLTTTPHAMILPSDLRGFVKEVDGCCFVNPERLTRGLVGGAFCRMAVSHGEDGTPKISAEVLKI